MVQPQQLSLLFARVLLAFWPDAASQLKSETVGRLDEQLLVNFQREAVVLSLEFVVVCTRDFEDDFDHPSGRTWVGGFSVPRHTDVLVSVQKDRKHVAKRQILGHVDFGESRLRRHVAVSARFGIARNPSHKQILFHVEQYNISAFGWQAHPFQNLQIPDLHGQLGV